MRRIFLAICALISAASARANWESAGAGNYDDGSRLIISVRGGAAMPFASMKNDLGSVVVGYYTDGSKVFIDDSACGGAAGTCSLIGAVDLGRLPVARPYDSFTWAGSFGVGMIAAGAPNWRLELDWLRVAESRYNANPLFSGEAEMSGASVENNVASAHASVSADIVSAMFYHDFFSGVRKPAGVMIPYAGFGLGYASAETVLTLADSYGDLSGDLALHDFGEAGAGGIWNFYTSTAHTNNFSMSAAVGFSYGMDDGLFFDMGVRATFVPRITWALNNSADKDALTQKEHAVFSAENIIYANVYAGVRFEF